jgi:hypothetical protein
MAGELLKVEQAIHHKRIHIAERMNNTAELAAVVDQGVGGGPTKCKFGFYLVERDGRLTLSFGDRKRVQNLHVGDAQVVQCQTLRDGGLLRTYKQVVSYL